MAALFIWLNSLFQVPAAAVSYVLCFVLVVIFLQRRTEPLLPAVCLFASMHLTKATAKRLTTIRRWLITIPPLLQLALEVLVHRRVLSASCPCPVLRQRNRGFVPPWALWLCLGMYCNWLKAN
ncbi:hypothetical protein BDR05DRAFT_572575 [Suillus weaverae]|nr:hypothetical protein BDR05DRAFT_572575 [Suillus weaverae]